MNILVSLTQFPGDLEENYYEKYIMNNYLYGGITISHVLDFYGNSHKKFIIALHRKGN